MCNIAYIVQNEARFLSDYSGVCSYSALVLYKTHHYIPRGLVELKILKIRYNFGNGWAGQAPTRIFFWGKTYFFYIFVRTCPTCLKEMDRAIGGWPIRIFFVFLYFFKLDKTPEPGIESYCWLSTDQFIMVGLWYYNQSGVTDLLIMRDLHYDQMCFKSVKTLGVPHS